MEQIVCSLLIFYLFTKVNCYNNFEFQMIFEKVAHSKTKAEVISITTARHLADCRLHSNLHKKREKETPVSLSVSFLP